MKKNVVFFFLSVSLFSFAQTQNFWTRKSDFGGMKRERAIGFSINGKGYLGTGIDTNETVKNDLWEYDPIVDTWTQKASLPASVRRNAIGFSIDDKGYVGMGIDSTEAFIGNVLNDFWEYNPLSNSWTQKANYPGAGGLGVYFATAFSLDHKGYVCCGKIGSDMYIDEVWEYKPALNQWGQRGDFPGGARYQLSSFVIDNLAYVGLGADYNIYRKDIWEYHPGSDTWIQKADMAGGERGSASTFTLGQRGFVCLGIDGGLKNDLWEYNPFQDSWTARATYDGSARKSAVAFTIFGRAYVGTGDGYSGKKASMYEYMPVAVLGTEDFSASNQISVFPNPVIDHFMIQSDFKEELNCALYTLEGKLILNINRGFASSQRVDRHDIPSGIYLLVAHDEKGNQIGTQKIIFL